MQKVHWSQLQSNPFLQALHPDMLTEEGFKLEKLDRIVGMSRYADKVPLEVTFDRSYLVGYIERAVFQKLCLRDWNQAQPVISEAWNAYKASRK